MELLGTEMKNSLEGFKNRSNMNWQKKESVDFKIDNTNDLIWRTEKKKQRMKKSEQCLRNL